MSVSKRRVRVELPKRMLCVVCVVAALQPDESAPVQPTEDLFRISDLRLLDPDADQDSGARQRKARPYLCYLS